MKTGIVWFRNDLRVYDHPALHAAVERSERVVPVFIFDERLLKGRHGGSNRNRFLLESLKDLKSSLQGMGGNLVVRSGKPEQVLQELAEEVGAEAVYVTTDHIAYAQRRDHRVREALDVELIGCPGRLIIDDVEVIKNGSGDPMKVFTPFYRRWDEVGRRKVLDRPQQIKLPVSVTVGSLPAVEELTNKNELSPTVVLGGETAGRKRLQEFLQNGVAKYHQRNDSLAEEGTSRLSAYLHFGCISPREAEDMLTGGKGAEAWRRQLCWRDFYHYVLQHFPDNARQEFQSRYRSFTWSYDEKLLQAWKDGRTGFPVVDAAMRQLKAEGWMHNRARLIVGSFLTKDLGIDWREGESHFMRWLVDGDEANNNGNWQWIASVGVDPAPVFKRIFNPELQQKKFDPENEYVRRYLPEWQDADYPEPIVDHKEARQAALERYSQT